jgi:feruloyl esterase
MLISLGGVMNTPTTVLMAAVLSASLAVALRAQNGRAAACTALANTALPNTSITAAETVTGGSFTVPGTTNAMNNLPPFCRIAGAIKPTQESEIRFEVWLPLDKWNGKFAGVGNGGWAGTISYGQLQEELRRGYAAASTNTGHQAGPALDAARFAFEHPEQLVDFAYRAHHETTLKAKALVNAFYGQAPERAYWFGCSSGGNEGLHEAQRFPEDYDGIVAGAPANNFTRLMAGDFDATQAVLKNPASNLPATALGVLYRGVLAACDATDGVTDGVVEDPRRCRFDPGTLQCAANQKQDSCLTAAQVDAARRVYRGPTNPAGTRIYPGLSVGSEPFWPNRDAASPFPIPISYYKWLVFRDPNWDWTTLDMTRTADYEAIQKAEVKLAPILNATNPDLRQFRTRGGKLLQWHGWSDQLIAPQNSIDYYESVRSFFGGNTADVQSFYRLFMAPGMTHCSGGTGPNTIDMQAVLEEWVEKGKAPERVIATHQVNGVVDRSRPLCPYPQVSTYKGQGDTNDADSFACRAPR